MPNEYDDTLATLDEDGRPPATRLGNAEKARNIYQIQLQADIQRAKKRALVKGLVDGNPPYSEALLRQQGRSAQCNVNWRIAESYLNNALGAFYDIFSEAPTYCTVKTDAGSKDQQQEWSGIITEEFDRALKQDAAFDYTLQLSQHEMVLYGNGPVFFEDFFDWRGKSILCGAMKVPERTKSTTSEWELSFLECDYLCHQLYERIRNEKMASLGGWNVKATREAIMKANPDYLRGGLYRTWEWHQQEIKNGAYYYSARSNVISTVHVFFKEFPKKGMDSGGISHKIFVVNDDTGSKEFLFERDNRFKDWRECVHPMYYDHGGGGFHHSVTGMGVKMFSAMEYQNRLLCNLADKAFLPKVMFKPTTEGQAEEMILDQQTDYAILKPGYDFVQVPVQGVINDAMVINREMTGIIASNLSSYRQNMEEKSGNPVTATEIQARMGEQARLGKTQLNRYYAQLGHLYAEMYRRITNPNTADWRPGGKQALEFQERCMKRGVPKAALLKTESVIATRVVGQGSAYMRQQELQFLLGLIAMLPEQGRDNLIRDIVSSRAGQSFVDRYYPVGSEFNKPTDQDAFAMSQVADMKVGVPAVVTGTQNPVIFARTFIEAGKQAVQSIEQGANPQEIVGFLDLLGQAAAAHLQKMAADPSRKQVYQMLQAQWAELAQIHDKLVEMLQNQANDQQRRQQEMMAQAAQQNGELALKKERQDVELGLKAEKSRFSIADKAAKSRQDQAREVQGMVLADMKTASEIRRKNAESKAKANSKSE